MSRGQVLLSCFCTVITCLIFIGFSLHPSIGSEILGEGRVRLKDNARSWKPWRNSRLCSLFGTCGSHEQSRIEFEIDVTEQRRILEDPGCEGIIQPNKPINDQWIMHKIPQYVLDHAPLVHLYSGEHFWPSDIAEHLTHVTPNLNYTPIQAKSINPNLTNLDRLNEYSHGRYVYLKSDDNVEERPDWLESKKNIPNASNHADGRASKDQGKDYRPGRSDAPAVLIVVNKGHGIVDAFWFYFYSYNLGNVVLNVRFGNHVGDWEHSLVRFQDGKPKVVFFSEHNFGSAYSYSAVEKVGKRVSIQRRCSGSEISCH